MKITAVIPAYNEEKRITETVRDVKEKISNVVVIDDGSTDQTAELALAAGAKVLRHSHNRGQGAALQTGLIFAIRNNADIILTFDADGQHQASDIDNVLKPVMLGEADVVLGSRFLNRENKKQVPALKRLILLLAAWFTRLYTGLNITDTHNGFRALSATAAAAIEIRQDGMAHASEIIEQIKKNKLKLKEVPVNILYTKYSKDKGQRLSNSFKIVFDLILGRITK